MKQTWISKIAFILLLGIALPTTAQEQHEQRERKPREVPSPERNALNISKEMKKTLKLTDEQSTKVYELYLKQEKQMMKSANSSGNRIPHPGGGMGRPPMGVGPEMVGGMPSHGGMAGTPGKISPENMEKQAKEMEKKREKAQKKMDKKMKKILSDEQYMGWKEMEAKRQEAEQKARQEKMNMPSCYHQHAQCTYSK